MEQHCQPGLSLPLLETSVVILNRRIRRTAEKSAGEVPVDSPIDSKPLKEVNQMLESEKNSYNSTSVDDTLHTFVPTPNVRNGFRRKKGDSPFVYNLNLKVKKEKKQSNCTNPDPWARIVGSRNTAAIYMDGIATTALFDTGAEIQLQGSHSSWKTWKNGDSFSSLEKS